MSETEEEKKKTILWFETMDRAFLVFNKIQNKRLPDLMSLLSHNTIILSREFTKKEYQLILN